MSETHLLASFDVSWAGDELVKLLLGKESEGESHWNWELKILVPAQGIWLRVEAIVDVADQEGGLGLAQEMLKVMHDCREGFVTWSVNGDDVEVPEADL